MILITPQEILRRMIRNTRGIKILYLTGMFLLLIIFWQSVVTGDPNSRSLRHRASAKIGVLLGINHQPTPEETFWVRIGAAVLYMGGVIFIIQKPRHEFKKLCARMDDAQWALYRGAYVSGMNLFAPTEMLLYSEGFRGRFVRVPYTWVQEVHLIIPKPKRAWEWAYGDRLKIVYDDGRRHSVGMFIFKANHPAVIAARIAAVNQLEVKREIEQ